VSLVLAAHLSATFFDLATVAVRFPGAVGGSSDGVGVGVGLAVALGLAVGPGLVVGLGLEVGLGDDVGVGVDVGIGEVDAVGTAVGVGVAVPPDPNEIRTSSPPDAVPSVVITTPVNGSVKVSPAPRGASVKLVVPGVVSISCYWERIE